MMQVRSSSNVEDLEGCSGAGLYDSIANVENTCALHAAMHARTSGRRNATSQMHSMHAPARGADRAMVC